LVPVWLVFATQNSLDVHHILEEDISRGLQEVLSTYAKINHRVKSCHHSVASVPGMDGWDDNNHESSHDHPKTTSVDNEEYLDSVLALYPFAAGLRELHIIATYRRMGVESGASCDVVVMAHLYNSAQIQSQCASWRDMEFVIGTQTTQHIFLGGRPTTFEQCFLKAELAMGLSVQSIRSTNMNDLQTSLRASDGSSPRRLTMDDMPVTNIVALRSIEANVRHVERSADNLELVLNAALHGIDRSKFKQDQEGNLVSRNELLKLTSRKPKATICQILAVLEERLVQEAPTLCFDFCGFKAVCFSLLMAISKQITSAYSLATGIEAAGRNSKPITCMVAFEILAKAKFSKIVAPFTGVPHYGERILNEVATMLEIFVKDNGSVGMNELDQFAAGLSWKSCQAQFGELALEQVQEASTQRPTLDSMTEEERELATRWGDISNLRVLSGMIDNNRSYIATSRARR
jgi:hypothetical protein